MQRKMSNMAFKKKYKLGATIGTGSFAKVKHATDKKDGSVWAIKIMDKKSMTSADIAAFYIEVDILRKLTSVGGIVQMREAFETDKLFYIVMELMKGGELFERVAEKTRFTENECKLVVRDVCTILHLTHQHGIVHRDLKPENLLYQTKDEASQLKIADFGLSKLIKFGTKIVATACGTPGYVAPEVLRRDAYGSSVDMWSIGIITYVLLCGFPPFYDQSNAVLFKKIKAGKFSFPSPYWDDISPEARQFVRQLLKVDPKRRLTAPKVLAHPWIQSYRDAKTSSLASPDLHIQTELKQYNARRRLKAMMLVARYSSHHDDLDTQTLHGNGAKTGSSDGRTPLSTCWNDQQSPKPTNNGGESRDKKEGSAACTLL